MPAHLAIVKNHTIGIAGDQIPIILRKFKTRYSCLTAFDFSHKVLTLLSIQVKYPKRVIEIAADVKPIHLVGVDLEYILKILADPLIPQLQIKGLSCEGLLAESFLAQVAHYGTSFGTGIIYVIDAHKDQTLLIIIKKHVHNVG